MATKYRVTWPWCQVSAVSLPTAHITKLSQAGLMTDTCKITCMDHGETHFKSFQV